MLPERRNTFLLIEFYGDSTEAVEVAVEEMLADCWGVSCDGDGEGGAVTCVVFFGRNVCAEGERHGWTVYYREKNTTR